MENKPYNFAEEEAAFSLDRAMTLHSFSLTCQMAGLDPVQQLTQISEAVKTAKQRRCSICRAEDIGNAYTRVAGMLKTQLLRDLLLAQEALEEVSK